VKLESFHGNKIFSAFVTYCTYILFLHFLHVVDECLFIAKPVAASLAAHPTKRQRHRPICRGGASCRKDINFKFTYLNVIKIRVSLQKNLRKFNLK
jgi:hypothetical protein